MGKGKNIFDAPEKIVNSRRAKGNIFALESQGYYEQSDLMITVIKPEYAKIFPTKYILGLLNSKLYYIWLKNRGKVKGDLFETYGKPLEEIPIHQSNKYDVDEVVKHVNDIIEGIGNEQVHMEQIDEIVCRIYNLTDAEKELVKQYK